MKHIVGVTFFVENKRPQIKGPISSSQAKQLSKRNDNTIPEGKYTLSNIRKKAGQLNYTFKYNDAELVVFKFNTVAEADQLIDQYI